MRDTAPVSDTDHAPHVHDDHAPAHDHEVAAEPLGDPDLGAWGSALLGGGVGLLVALALLAATLS